MYQIVPLVKTQQSAGLIQTNVPMVVEVNAVLKAIELEHTKLVRGRIQR